MHVSSEILLAAPSMINPQYIVFLRIWFLEETYTKHSGLFDCQGNLTETFKQPKDTSTVRQFLIYTCI